jgi:hypothetical protein
VIDPSAFHNSLTQFQSSVTTKPTTFIPISIAYIRLIMKLTVPKMDALSDNGFPIFKPYGDPWYFVAKDPEKEEGPHDVLPNVLRPSAMPT